ncbi:MAG: hypothetical protein QGM50_09075 [Anaerolineae bacterium]|nr:hypothetical protein [Anaerolineae bacterium]MDK1081197.1 hypothetical protein [Anaerolineae bacterium]MDK1118926.1 hypothetical protein [Anaerolineae bacterium]
MKGTDLDEILKKLNVAAEYADSGTHVGGGITVGPGRLAALEI